MNRNSAILTHRGLKNCDKSFTYHVVSKSVTCLSMSIKALVFREYKLSYQQAINNGSFGHYIYENVLLTNESHIKYTYVVAFNEVDKSIP